MTDPMPEHVSPLAQADPRPIPTSGVARQWELFTSGLEVLRDTLRRELLESWREMSQLILDQAAASARLGDASVGGGLTAYAEYRNAASRATLLDTLDRWERVRPLQRADLAIEAFHHGADELARRMPASLLATGPEVLEVLPGGGGLSRRRASRRTDGWALPFQGVVAATLASEEDEQLYAEGRYLLAIAHGIQELRRGWDRTRQAIDAVVAPSGATLPAPTIDSGEIVAGLEAEVSAAVAALDASIEGIPARAAHRLVRAAAWRRRPPRPGGFARRTRQFEHWATQLGSLQSELRFERAQDGVERRVLALAERTCATLEAERQELLEAIDQLVSWLDGQLAGQSDAPPMPPPRGAVVPAARRASDLAAAVRRIFDSLPDEVELVRRLEPAPKRRALRKEIAPDRMATAAFERVGESRFGAIFADTQAAHVGLLQQIERARQVVEFASEGEGEADDASVAREALQNARTLLEVDRGATVATLAVEREMAARTLAEMFLQNRLLLTRSRLGALAHIGRLGARQGVGAVAAAALPAVLLALKSAGRAAGRLWRRFLVAIQWIPAGEAKRHDVVRRPFLPQEFIGDPRARELPAIYRRLFRFEAVDDPRFLVGRDREMQALVEAREFWEAGRPVATLVVGERGSGKTSLINCVLEGPLAGLPVIRGEFIDRVATAAGVRQFLATLCDTTPDQLEATLLAERRVVVLEETERTFLREMNGFGGIRELQRLIASTCGTTLWVVVLNQHAFRFLHASVKLGDSFSHRLNAASATPEAVRDAILVRHHLSGLRLRFVPPPSQRTVWARFRRRIRGNGDPEQLFFAGLARESAGVFRTAFELWLGQIDSVQAGTLVMRPMAAPDVDAVIEALDTDDLFTLAAIAQHGSLTPEEHAAVFRRNPAASRAELDDLLAREIIEPEPTRPGFRVRPVALRVAREALHRRNLG